jgi:hypothetical protein
MLSILYFILTCVKQVKTSTTLYITCIDGVKQLKVSSVFYPATLGTLKYRHMAIQASLLLLVVNLLT